MKLTDFRVTEAPTSGSLAGNERRDPSKKDRGEIERQPTSLPARIRATDSVSVSGGDVSK